MSGKKIKRPSLTDNVYAKFNIYNSIYTHEKCLEKSRTAIKNGWFTNLLNDYPPLLNSDDMTALTNRYIDILRNLPETSITEDYKIVRNNDTKRRFDKLIIDIASLGSKELLNNLNIHSGINKKLSEAFAHDLLKTVTANLVKTDQPDTVVFDNKGYYSLHIKNHIHSLVSVISSGSALAEEKLNNEQISNLIQDIQKLVRETLFNEKPEADYIYLKKLSTKKEAARLVLDIFNFAKADYEVSHARLKPDISELIGVDSVKFIELFDGHASDAVISYLGAVMSDIFKMAKEYNNIYEKAHHALNAYLKDEKYSLIKLGMANPDNTQDLNDQAANFRKTIYYPLEHKGEAIAATGLTLAFGGLGLGSFVLYKMLSSEADPESKPQTQQRPR